MMLTSVWCSFDVFGQATGYLLFVAGLGNLFFVRRSLLGVSLELTQCRPRVSRLASFLVGLACLCSALDKLGLKI